MNLNWAQKTTTLVVGLVLAAGLAGCRIHTEKDANGEDKKVQIDTPFGGIHVNTDQTTAADLGLPVYPGATQVKGDGDHKSADVHLGFGEWELKVKVVSYQTPDSEDKVTAFYKKALGRYGNVITCQGKTPVGKPATTTEGLTCDDDVDTTTTHSTNQDIGNGKTVIHSESSDSEGELKLKAGSKRHQHIVGFENPSNSQTRFALVALDLPTEMGSGSEKRD
jgi:hypothetical protein